jgi:hypothetical protein
MRRRRIKMIQNLNEKEIAESMSLFERKIFTSSSGRILNWKIECDALTDRDWECLAYLIASAVEFSRVEGVVSGGLVLAEKLSEHLSEEGPLLIVDDVLTTGISMERQRDGREAIGFVVYARGRCPDWIRSVWQMGI